MIATERDVFRHWKRRADLARDFPGNTDARSRALQTWAEAIFEAGTFEALDYAHDRNIAISMMAVVAMLWEARSRLADLEADTARLDFLAAETARGAWPSLICNEEGGWAVSYEHWTKCPEPPFSSATTRQAPAWRNSIREAIDAAMEARKKCLSS